MTGVQTCALPISKFGHVWRRFEAPGWIGYCSDPSTALTPFLFFRFPRSLRHHSNIISFVRHITAWPRRCDSASRPPHLQIYWRQLRACVIRARLGPNGMASRGPFGPAVSVW